MGKGFEIASKVPPPIYTAIALQIRWQLYLEFTSILLHVYLRYDKFLHTKVLEYPRDGVHQFIQNLVYKCDGNGFRSRHNFLTILQ